MKKRSFSLLVLFILFSVSGFGQTLWVNDNYGYSVEIPKEYEQVEKTGKNVDLSISNGLEKIVIVVKTIPKEYASYSLWDLLGDIDTYAKDFENGSKEFATSFTAINYGKTFIGGLDAFWMTAKIDNSPIYQKTYQIKKEHLIFSITMSCNERRAKDVSKCWLRFKNTIGFY